MSRAMALAGLVACGGPQPPPPLAEPVVAAVAAVAAPVTSTPTPEALPERWLKGSTHVHAAPSGDSTAPVDEVIGWYRTRGYDFIVLTDHNRVTAVDSPELIVLPGVELTHNPARCDPPPPLPDGRCRIHVNALAVSGRPPGRIEWAERDSPRRVDMYQRALDTTAGLGGIAQLNHPQWHWGMTGPLLTELARRGLVLVEIANRQFDPWDAGDGRFPSSEALWDQALGAGVALWGVASDDAHSYDRPGRYPAGGGWVMVRAAREPAAIRAALAAGRFYASTGVTLERAGVEDGMLSVEVGPGSPGGHHIAFIGGGQVLAELCGEVAAYPVAEAPGYVRAVVHRDDGARAWVQPARP